MSTDFQHSTLSQTTASLAGIEENRHKGEFYCVQFLKTMSHLCILNSNVVDLKTRPISGGG